MQKKPLHMMLEIKVLAWDRHKKNVAELNWLMGSFYLEFDAN